MTSNVSNLLYMRSVVPDLEKSMDTYSLRQKAISNNIANAMTPGYKAQKVSFEEEYKKLLEPVPLRGIRTHENHIQIPQMKKLADIDPEIVFKESPLNDTGLNNVDIDKEMAEMAENSLRFEMATKLVNRRFGGVRRAIQGRV